MSSHPAVLPLLLAQLALAAAPAGETNHPAAAYANLQGKVVLENERVVVESFVMEPGQWSGRYSPRDNHLQVFIKGGVLTSKESGRAVLWRDGRVAWRSATERLDDGVINTGQTRIEFVWVTLKPARKPAAPAERVPHLNYPNIPGEDVLENEAVIVQRFLVKPGQWEGVHAHHPNMLYIHVKGGQWATRSKHEPEHAYPEPSPDGEVGWMQPFDISDGHESGNIGKEPIDLIWVTLKY